MSTNRVLPARPSLEQLKKQAKELAKGKGLKLADAQFTLAREYGFENWSRLKRHINIAQPPRHWSDDVWGADTWPFFAAILAADEQRVRQMLDTNPSLADRQYGYLQALHFAVRAESASMVRLLLDAGANPLAEGWSGRFGNEVRDDTPLARARDRGLNEIAKLLEHAANGRVPTEGAMYMKAKGRTPRQELEHQMMLASHNGDIEAAKRLLEEHPDLASAGLYEGVHQNHPELVRLLLDHGAKTDQPGFFATWYTPLMHALRYPEPRYELAEMLLAHGVDVNDVNGMGMTPLHVLSGQATVPAVEWLLDRGAEMESRDDQYESRPLAWAARAGRRDMVTMLLTRGAVVVHPEDPAWATPVEWAERRGHHGIAELLRAADRGNFNPPA